MSNTVIPELVVVPELSVRIATGETCYPDEGGFAAHWAEVSTADPNLVRTLSKLTDKSALLRCAMLDVIGRLTKHEVINGTTRFVFTIEDLHYRKPGTNTNVA